MSEGKDAPLPEGMLPAESVDESGSPLVEDVQKRTPDTQGRPAPEKGKSPTDAPGSSRDVA